MISIAGEVLNPDESYEAKCGVYRQMEIEGFPSVTLDAGTQSMSVGKAPGAVLHNEPAAMLNARANLKGSMSRM